MPILVQYLHAIGSFQGLLLAGLLVFGSQNTNASRILGAWCLFLALSFLGSFIAMDGEMNMFTGLIGFSSFLPAAYGAFLYLYCRHAIVERALVPKDLWHFLPIVSCYLLNIELLTASAEVKLDAILNGPTILTPIIVAQSILFLQAFIYFWLSVRLIRRYQKQAKNTLSSFNPDIFAWLWKLLILDLVIWSLKAVAVSSEYRFSISTLADVLILVLIYSIALAQWRDPKLFKIEQLETNSKNPEDHLSVTDIKNRSESLNTENKNSQSIDIKSPAKTTGALDPSIRSSLLRTVRLHMNEQQAYLDNQLTLSRLAEAVGVSTHHLSEVLNQQEGKNFYQFVNEYRIEHICQLMKQDSSIKILDLAMTAGFSSKSTFNAVFKQFTNLTPSQYRNQLS
jgi:AraC-like DNA-binding protein